MKKYHTSNLLRGIITVFATLELYTFASAQTTTPTPTPGVPATALGDIAMINLFLLAFASICMTIGIVMLIKEKTALH